MFNIEQMSASHTSNHKLKTSTKKIFVET